jgi:L-lactate utilization protein LutC
MAPVARRAGSAEAPASTNRPITISTAIAIKNANTGLSRTATAIMDNGAQEGKFLTVLPASYINLGQLVSNCVNRRY